MFPANTWLFDLEIRRAIPEKDKPKEPGILYCKHWGDHAGMGVSCLVASRPDGTDTRVFTNDLVATAGGLFPDANASDPYHLSHFWRLVQDAELIISYGGRNFDAKVLAALGLHIPARIHLDILYEAKKSLRNQAPKGYKLQDVSLRCGGPMKTQDGAQAPILWQRGQRATVIQYCINDVMMLSAITQHYAKSFCCIPDILGAPLTLRTPTLIAQEDYFK